jgi:hypothetical protein
MTHIMAVLLLALAVTALLGPSPGEATPLDDYVSKPDPSYSYHEISAVKGVGYTLYTLNMTSQTWKTGLKMSLFSICSVFWLCCSCCCCLLLLFVVVVLSTMDIVAKHEHPLVTMMSREAIILCRRKQCIKLIHVFIFVVDDYRMMSMYNDMILWSKEYM